MLCSEAPRSPTPHPRHGMLVDLHGHERHMSDKLTDKMRDEPKHQQQRDKENMNPQQQPQARSARVNLRL